MFQGLKAAGPGKHSSPWYTYSFSPKGENSRWSSPWGPAAPSCRPHYLLPHLPGTVTTSTCCARGPGPQGDPPDEPAAKFLRRALQDVGDSGREPPRGSWENRATACQGIGGAPQRNAHRSCVREGTPPVLFCKWGVRGGVRGSQSWRLRPPLDPSDSCICTLARPIFVAQI